MKIYRYIWTHPDTRQRVTYFHPTENDAKYWGSHHVEQLLRLSKDQIATLPDGVVQEMDVPLSNAADFAHWLNAQITGAL